MPQSRRDLYQAHKLMTQRAALALLRGEPDLPDQPLRRLNVGTFFGGLAALVLGTILAIVVVLGHDHKQPQLGPGVLIIDSQNHAPYVFCGNVRHQELCPVVNYTSAWLALSRGAGQVTASPQAIHKYPQGPLLGIPSLPPLPASSQLIRQPWSVCEHGSNVTSVSSAIPIGGRLLTAGQALIVHAAGTSSQVPGSSSQYWVLWQGRRYPIARRLFGSLRTTSSYTVSLSWLDALPAGIPWAPPRIDGRSFMVRGPTGGLANPGKVYSVATGGGGFQYYVLVGAGRLKQITQLQASLLQFAGESPTPVPMPPAAVGQDVVGNFDNSLPGIPPVVPQISVPPSLCTVYPVSGGTGRHPDQIMVDAQVGPSLASPYNSRLVLMPPESGALVGVEQAPGTSPAPLNYFLVTAGRAYVLQSRAVARRLGYDVHQAVILPAGVVPRLIQTGHPLYPSEALAQVSPGG